MSQCPKCGCQVEDPMLGKVPIHDVERCGGSLAAPTGSANTPLRAEVKDGKLVVEIGIETLEWAIRNRKDFPDNG